MSDREWWWTSGDLKLCIDHGRTRCGTCLENEANEAEVESLRSQLADADRVAELAKKEVERLQLELVVEVPHLKAEIDQLKAEVAELRSRLPLDSANYRTRLELRQEIARGEARLAGAKFESNRLSDELTRTRAAYAVLRGAAEWIASDTYKHVPSHWKEIAAAQMTRAREALARADELIKP